MRLRLAFFMKSILKNIKKNKMGRGDKKTKKGKIFKGSFGKVRPASKKEAVSKPKEAAEKK